MFNIKYTDLKKAKKQYSSNLKNKDINSYKLHEKISSTLNHSMQSRSNISETTASKSNTTKTFSSNYHKPIQEKKSFQIKKCSYLDFLEFRKPKNSFPLGNQEKRFQWQNLQNQNIVTCPEIPFKPHRKQFLLKENFGEGLLGFLNNRQVVDEKPKIKRLRRCKSEINLNMNNNCVQNIDFDISRRVVDPLYNNEKLKIRRKKMYSNWEKFLYHKTDGGLKSLFELTPIDIPIKGKKLYRSKSYGGKHINLFGDDYGQYEMPTHTKKQFFDNMCYFDHIKDENLICEMNNCWKNKRSKTVVNQSGKFKTDIEIYLERSAHKLRLRNYDKGNNSFNNLNKTVSGKSLSKIKRNIKKNLN